jgi:hypothetical protein
MRFKAKLVPEQLSLLYHVIAPMARIASSSASHGHGQPDPISTAAWTRNGCILHFDDKYVRLYCRGRSSDADQVQCYAEFLASNGGGGASGIFVDYRIESAADGNAICMEIDLVQFRMALQSLVQDKRQHNHHHNHHSQQQVLTDQHYHYTVLKLAKRNGVPCLCLDAFTTGEGKSSGGGLSAAAAVLPSIQVHHSISVRILRLADVLAHFRPPRLSRKNPDVQLELPGDRPIRTVMEGLKALKGGGGHNQSRSFATSSASSSSACGVTLRASTAGELTISLDSDGAALRAFFHCLPLVDRASNSSNENAENRGDEDNGRRHSRSSSSQPESVARVRVDARKLCGCLHWQNNPNFPSRRAVLCLAENEMVILHVDLHPPGIGFQTYYVPVLYLAPDEDGENNDNGGGIL